MKKLPGIVLTLSLVTSAATPTSAGQSTKSAQQKPPQQGSQPAQGQAGQQAGQAPPAPQVTPEQYKELQTIQNELDPDKQIQMVNEFEKKYPNSPLLTHAYFFGATAFQQKGNVSKILEYGEKSLKLDPNNLRTLLVMASMLPQPQNLQGSDAEKEKKLGGAETDANKALQLIAQLPKPANLTDEQFEKNKKMLSNSAHASLGLVHLERSQSGLQGPDKDELAKAEQEYKTAVSGDNPDPQDYYRLGEAYTMDGKTDEAIDAFSKASQLSQGSPLQALADKQIAKLKQSKSEAKPATKQ